MEPGGAPNWTLFACLVVKFAIERNYRVRSPRFSETRLAGAALDQHVGVTQYGDFWFFVGHGFSPPSVFGINYSASRNRSSEFRAILVMCCRKRSLAYDFWEIDGTLGQNDPIRQYSTQP